MEIMCTMMKERITSWSHSTYALLLPLPPKPPWLPLSTGFTTSTMLCKHYHESLPSTKATYTALISFNVIASTGSITIKNTFIFMMEKYSATQNNFFAWIFESHFGHHHQRQRERKRDRYLKEKWDNWGLEREAKGKEREIESGQKPRKGWSPPPLRYVDRAN